MPASILNVAVIGGGGREHALAWRIRRSPRCGALHVLPGNPGAEREGVCAPVPVRAPFDEIVAYCRVHDIGLVVVGPEDPLAAGIVDRLEAAGIPAFGPTAAAARLEASKTFAKEVMRAAGVPTAASATFTDSAAAIAYLDAVGSPCVVKADGLAAGKGVTVAMSREQAEAAIRDALDGRAFGDAGASVLIEAFLDGVEVSLMAFCDGRVVRVMDSVQDHKRAYDGDQGPNTGGMGAITPAPVLTPELRDRAVREILEPVVAEMARRGTPYRGVLYAGLMLTARGPEVVEFNCRFGDPETQVLMPRMASDPLDVFEACMRGGLEALELRWEPDTCVCVVAASEGYPGAVVKGRVIEGSLDPVHGAAGDDSSAAGAADESGAKGIVFHAGTARDAEGRIVTAGGRVLNAVARGPDAATARARAYERLAEVRFEGMHFRKDIGLRAG